MLERYSLGTGDRFGQEGEAQLKAIQKVAEEDGVTVTPVWNKSHREHKIIGTRPQEVRIEADNAVENLRWPASYFVDADHITLDIVDDYIEYSDFFTIDVAEYIGNGVDPESRAAFIRQNEDYTGKVNIPGISEEFMVTKDFLADWADQYLVAIQKAAELYRFVNNKKKRENVVYEISMDEVETPQTPIALFFILKTVAEFKIPIHTIAPKFTGDFYKGVDYVGDIDQFVKEFDQDILVIAHAVETFHIPSSLKLSVHSGSDKFSLYPHIHRLIKKHGAGIHLKTSGTTWLEELIGLAASGDEPLELAKSIYEEALSRLEELTKPYAPVVDISKEELPLLDEVAIWNSRQFVEALRHDQDKAAYNPSLRQLLHCAYKIAAERGQEFVDALRKYEQEIAPNVTKNLYDRHLKPLFVGD